MHFLFVACGALDQGRRRTGRHGAYRTLCPRMCRAAEAGMTTAEYAVGTVAACGFAGLLFKILTSDKVNTMVTGIVERALELPF